MKKSEGGRRHGSFGYHLIASGWVSAVCADSPGEILTGKYLGGDNYAAAYTDNSSFLIIVIPVGTYLYHIAAGKHTFADPLFDRIDGLIYRIGGVDPGKGMRLEGISGSASGHERDYDTDGLSDPADPRACPS